MISGKASFQSLNFFFFLDKIFFVGYVIWELKIQEIIQSIRFLIWNGILFSIIIVCIWMVIKRYSLCCKHIFSIGYNSDNTLKKQLKPYLVVAIVPPTVDALFNSVSMRLMFFGETFTCNPWLFLLYLWKTGSNDVFILAICSHYD